MRGFINSSVVYLLVIFSSFAAGQNNAVVIEIQVDRSILTNKESPNFIFILKNTSGAPLYVLDFDKRPDIQHSFFRLDFYRKNAQGLYESFYPPRTVTNFGSISLKNYTYLRDGEKLQRQMYPPPVYFEYFTSGEYGAVLHFIALGAKADGKPFLEGSYKSKMVLFKVK